MVVIFLTLFQVSVWLMLYVRKLDNLNFTLNIQTVMPEQSKLPDQTAPNEQSDQGSTLLSIHHKILYILSGSQMCLCEINIYGPRHEKTCLRRFANNTGIDQPTHLCSLISAFVIRFFWKVLYVILLHVKFQFSSLSL